MLAQPGDFPHGLLRPRQRRRQQSTPFPESNVTHATLLRQAGYATGYIGKWHMGQQAGQRPGFDYSASFIGQGKYFDCPFEVNGAGDPDQGLD